MASLKSDHTSFVKRLNRIKQIHSIFVFQFFYRYNADNFYFLFNNLFTTYIFISILQIVVEYREKFRTLPLRLTPKVPFINIIMIGITGSGKSSLLRTFTTALTNSDYIKDIYRVADKQGREDSVTKKVRYNEPDCFKLQLLKENYN